MTAREPQTHLAERAALYLAGAMTPEERRAFESEVERGGLDCREQIRQLERGVEALADAAGAVTPDARRLDRTLDRIAAGAEPASGKPEAGRAWSQWAEDDTGGLFTLRRDEGEWEATGVDGVDVRRLFVDRPHNRMTAMFRMAPGTAYPSHVHDGAEECLVLEGDLHVGEIVLGPGDYQRAPGGSHHGLQRTESGCLLLVTCSLNDEWE